MIRKEEETKVRDENGENRTKEKKEKGDQSHGWKSHVFPAGARDQCSSSGRKTGFRKLIFEEGEEK